MTQLVTFISAFLAVAGAVIAKTTIQTILALVIWPYGWYLLLEHFLK